MNRKYSLMIATLLTAIPCLWSKNIDVFAKSTIENSIEYTLNEEDKTACLTNGKDSEGNIEIPSRIIDKGATYTVISVGENAFAGSNLQGIIIPDSVNIIKSGAFEHCENLTAVSLGENLNRIESGAFFWSGVTSVKIPDGVSYIGSKAFENCTKLSTIAIPNGVSYIGEEIFAGCTLLESAKLPEGMKTIPDRAFYGCERLTDINMSSSIETIGAQAMAHCLVNETNFPSNLKFIGDQAFDYCSELSYVILPEGLETIGDEAFARCVNLTCLEIPESAVNIGYHAFGSADGMTNLKKVICVKNSYVDLNKPFYFWTQYGVTYPEFSYKVSGASASGSIFGEYSFMAYVAVGLFLIAMISGIIIVFRGRNEKTLSE